MCSRYRASDGVPLAEEIMARLFLLPLCRLALARLGLTAYYALDLSLSRLSTLDSNVALISILPHHSTRQHLRQLGPVWRSSTQGRGGPCYIRDLLIFR